ncbi:hypothetical protein HMPREF0819_0797 [Streptococcus equinus ATCC 9812]|uniref:Uncharacterized protein n=1 Tax=Streptococcus equinus ATCC 9812 TaxID=525379 RepID=E8JP74_STREI|nr:hypothetical protein HMPREF0819_0797 [Streptococcus equinus ATCC 9812]
MIHRPPFWNHSKQHSSKTFKKMNTSIAVFWNHSKQHSSKTSVLSLRSIDRFWNHSKQHSSKTKDIYGKEIYEVLEPFETAQL